MPEMSPATADPPVSTAPAVAPGALAPGRDVVTGGDHATRVGALCRRTVLLGYVLVLFGTAAIPLCPLLTNTLIARVILTVAFGGVLLGAGLVVWGFVRTTLSRAKGKC